MLSPSPNAFKRVAIIGRPNVGKSTLFNKLTRTRSAVVKDEPGVTRDVLIHPAEWWGHTFEVVDTGGLTEDSRGLSPLIREQTIAALRSIDLLLVVMDGRAGLVPEDREVIKVAKESGKPILLVINKLDRQVDLDSELSEFYEFGMDLIPTAFEHDFGVDNVVEWVIARLPKNQTEVALIPKVAIIGKPNVGKSSLCNLLLGQKRMLVSEIAGTTVDAVEAEVEFGGKKYVLVDTAGLRRQARRNDGVEFLSVFKTQGAVDRADVVLLVIDAVTGPTDQDAKMLEMCLDKHRAIIVVANKIDLAKTARENAREWFRERIMREFSFFQDVRVVFTSAKTGYGIPDLFNEIEAVYERLHMRISTSQLNKFFTDVIRQAPAPVYGTTNVKFYYLTQTQQVPPSFIAFANHPQGVTPSYRRFLAKRIQENWDLRGVPVRIFVLPSGGS